MARRLPGRTMAACAVLMAVLAVGCKSTPPDAEPPPCPRAPRLAITDVGRAAYNSSAPCRAELGRSVRGRPIEATVFEGAEPAVLVIGGIHGDESASAHLVEHLLVHLRVRPEDRAGRQIVLIPQANPDGLVVNTRYNRHGVDLNRNFPAGNFRASARNGQAPLSQPESRAVAAALERYRPSCIVSVHGPLNGIDPDGGRASYELAQRMVAVSPVPLRDLPALPGSLGSYAGKDLGLAMITYELPDKRLPGRDPAAYLEQHLPALLLAIREG